jgi:hypothetical protein
LSNWKYKGKYFIDAWATEAPYDYRSEWYPVNDLMPVTNDGGCIIQRNITIGEN